jgi:hypothetical protein
MYLSRYREERIAQLDSHPTAPRHALPARRLSKHGGVTLRALQTLIIPLISLCGACQPSRGGEGESCNFSGDFFTGSFSCNAGLVCVSFGSRCVPLHSEPAGGPCEGTSDPCVVGLICVHRNNASQCGDPLGPREVCGSDTDCADGLACLKECDNSSECLVPDAAAPCGNLQDAATDATVPFDGAQPDALSGEPG